MNSIIGIIPACFASTACRARPWRISWGSSDDPTGYEACRQSDLLESVFVATDDERIARAVEGFGGSAIMTSATHVSSTDRLAEAARGLDADIVVNIQGDYPFSTRS